MSDKWVDFLKLTKFSKKSMDRMDNKGYNEREF